MHGVCYNTYHIVSVASSEVGDFEELRSWSFCSHNAKFCALVREEAIFAVCKRCANEGLHACVKKNMVRYMRPHGRFAYCIFTLAVRQPPVLASCIEIYYCSMRYVCEKQKKNCRWFPAGPPRVFASLQPTI